MSLGRIGRVLGGGTNFMKILITGGAGFIGSHVVDKLIEQGDEVLIIDDLSTGSEDNINQSAKFIKIDIADDKISEIMKEFQPEVVIHLAAQKNVRVSLEDPVFDARVNILGSLNLIDLSHKLGIKKFIFASSGVAIYDENQEMPLTENSLENPMSPYGPG